MIKIGLGKSLAGGGWCMGGYSGPRLNGLVDFVLNWNVVSHRYDTEVCVCVCVWWGCLKQNPNNKINY